MSQPGPEGTPPSPLTLLLLAPGKAGSSRFPRRRGQIEAALPQPAPTPTGPPQKDPFRPPLPPPQSCQTAGKRRKPLNVADKAGRKPQKIRNAATAKLAGGEGLPAPP